MIIARDYISKNKIKWSFNREAENFLIRLDYFKKVLDCKKI